MLPDETAQKRDHSNAMSSGVYTMQSKSTGLVCNRSHGLVEIFPPPSLSKFCSH